MNDRKSNAKTDKSNLFYVQPAGCDTALVQIEFIGELTEKWTNPLQ